MKESGSVRRAEELARRFKSASGTQTKRLDDTALIVDERIDQMQADLTKKLGDNVTVKIKRSRVETRMTIIMKGSLANTDPQLDNISSALIES